MSYAEIISKVATDLSLPKILVDKTYKAYWHSVREHIESLPLKKDLTDDEFQELQPNVNIPSIGKLYVTLERYKNVKKHHNRITEIKENKKKR